MIGSSPTDALITFTWLIRREHHWKMVVNSVRLRPVAAPPDRQEYYRAEIDLLTPEERDIHLMMLERAQIRMTQAGVRIPDDGLDEYGNLKEPL